MMEQAPTPGAEQQQQHKVSADAFYGTYHGHAPEHLATVRAALEEAGHPDTIWLAGDSSLDNKYWFDASAPALRGYDRVLSPPVMKQDVAYWMNHELATRQQPSFCCINTAVEATTLDDRACGSLLPQDRFLREHIREDDALVVSVGGNDIALAPLLGTILSIVALVHCTPQVVLESCACARPPNLGFDVGCYGCGLPGCVAGLVGWPPGFGYLVDLFKNRVQNYITRLVANHKPRVVVVCMIYYPFETPGASWADAALGALCYDRWPSKLQAAIRLVFAHATSQIRVAGTTVVALALHDVLDCRDASHYCQRVEPSPVGGRKMARALLDAIFNSELLEGYQSHQPPAPHAHPQR